VDAGDLVALPTLLPLPLDGEDLFAASHEAGECKGSRRRASYMSRLASSGAISARWRRSAAGTARAAASGMPAMTADSRLSQITVPPASATARAPSAP